MKKKLKLSEVKVQSFVTSEIAADKIKGGTLQNTAFSCLAYISCNPLACIVSNNGPVCLA